MIHKRSSQAGIQAHVALEPSAASQSTSNINNNIIINKRDDGKEDIVITREAKDIETPIEENDKIDVKTAILEAYAQILLNQDKALLSNLIFKNSIIVPTDSLANIIKTAIKAENVEIYYDEDIKCCATKANPIRKIEAIKIIKENGEITTDFKQVYNKEFNELTNNYHLCLKYCIQ